MIGAALVDPAGYATDAHYNKAMEHATLYAYLACGPFYLYFWARMAQKVSYRARDCFMVLIPVWSYVFTVKVIWRLTSLTDRPWEHRPEELYADDES